MGFVSNANIVDEDFADISDWTANDYLGASSQATFDSKSCMYLDTGTGGAGSRGERIQDLGSFGARTVVSLSFQSNGLEAGTSGYGQFGLHICNGSRTIAVVFAVAKALAKNSAGTWDEIGTDLMAMDTWLEWTFDITWGTSSTTVMDVYLNKVLVAAALHTSQGNWYTDGVIHLTLSKNSTRCQTWIDEFKAGNLLINSDIFGFIDDKGSELNNIFGII